MVRSTKIPIYSEKSFDFLLNNIKPNLDKIRNAESGWVEKFMSEHDHHPTSHESFPALKLRYDPKDRATSDYQSAIELYTKITFIDKFQASNGMYWTVLSMSYLDYLNSRNKISDDDSKAADQVLKYYCCPWNPGKRDLARCTLSSLWRIVDLTIDDSRGDNRYELTKEAFQNTDMMQSLTDRIPFINREVTRGVLQFSLYRRKNSIELDKLDYQQLAVHINSVAGTSRIDMLTESDVFDMCSSFMDWFIDSGDKAKRQAEVAERNRKNTDNASDD